MSELFGTDIATIVTDALTGQLRPITVTRKGEYAAGVEYNAVTDRHEDTNGDPVADPEDDTFTTEGIEEDRKKFLEAGLITASEVPILMLAQPLGTDPKVEDEITLDGEVYTMTGIISRDPAGATWIVKGEL